MPDSAFELQLTHHSPMAKTRTNRLLLAYKRGELTADRLLEELSLVMEERLDFATIDHHREIRQGFPEVIFCEGKTEKQIAQIAVKVVRHGSVLFATRATKGQFRAVKKVIRLAHYNELARTIAANEHLVHKRGVGTILIVTAGTSDLPVALEAAETVRIMGNEMEMLVDVGVAGIHRILSQSRKLRNASVIIVVAGMEGALASVVGGLVAVPVIAVPTSVGYGASFKGVAALLGMLNSCAAGVTVVNIDNGYGAGVAASLMNRIRKPR